MFKKNVSILTSRPISGKDVKDLKRKIKICFPDLSDEDVDQLFPAKVEVQMLKLKNKATAYTCGNANPLFFDPEGRGDLLVPTVYALWKLPHIIESLYTYSEVSPKVLGGADLFLQGLIVPDGGLGDFSVGDLRAVSIPGNPFPFAVGTTEVGTEEVAKTGLKGKGLKLLHFFGDQLWGLGDKCSPDPSFTAARIFPMKDTQNSSGGAVVAADVADGIGAMSLSAQNEDRPQHPSYDALPSNLENEEKPDEDAAADDARHGDAVASVEDPDQTIEACLLGGLQSVADEDLPMLTSDFYSKHMLPAKPDGANVDIKKTSYKKLSKLLSTFEKKGLLTTKVVHKQDKLTAINRGHKLYTAFAPKERSEAAAASGSPSASTSGNTITVTYSYRVPTSLRPIFEADADKDALYSEEVVCSALRAYAEREGLSLVDGALKLDKLLVGHLFNKKEPQQEGDSHPFDDTMRRLLSKLAMFHTISRSTPEGVVEVVKKGAVKNISISMEDRMGGRKHVTHLAHVEAFGLSADELGAALQRKFKTSCSVTKLPGKTETGKEIALQGNLLQELPKYLKDEYGIEAHFVDVKKKGT
ncbi:Eukaryotic translation initiation factor 2D [Coccomyxa sp. Obi]|nr:Eukaryotic translation initiation factor 2D [Coccomyxa sp. Obi]